MTLSTGKRTKLTDEEWNEMNALRKAINQRPSSVHPDKMEEFTEYLVRSLKEMGN
jgi:uncharacterized alpha-E superfamily protein